MIKSHFRVTFILDIASSTLSKVFEDGLRIVQLCRSGREEEVIYAMMKDNELQKFIRSLIKGDKVAGATLMHDTVLSFIRSCMKDGFIINTSPRAYAKAIAKNNWLMQLRKRKLDISSLDDHENYIDPPNSYIIDYDTKIVVQSLLTRIPEDCMRILYYWALKYKMSEIADLMNITSQNYVKKKKHICLKKLIAAVDNDPKFKEELKLYV